MQRELEVLSEQYSQKCLENAHLAQALEAERQALRQCQRENQELNAHNQVSVPRGAMPEWGAGPHLRRLWVGVATPSAGISLISDIAQNGDRNSLQMGELVNELFKFGLLWAVALLGSLRCLLSISGFLLRHCKAGPEREGHYTWSRPRVPKAGTMFKCPPIKTIHYSHFWGSDHSLKICPIQRIGAHLKSWRGERLEVGLV